MRFFRRLLIIAVSLTAGGALCAPAAFASHSVWAKGGEPTCTITVTTPSTSSTTCTGTLSGQNGVQFLVNLDVRGVAVYQCQDSTGATVPGQTAVPAEGGSVTSFTPTKKDAMFITDPAGMAAPAAVSASQAGCADGTTAVDPALVTTKVQVWLASQGDGPILSTCASDPNGLSGTVALTTC
jgi:hypothetical protein